MSCVPRPTYSPFSVQSMPSPASVATTSLRTRPPPNVSECDENVPLRRGVQEQAGDVERIGRLFLQLVMVDHGVRAQPDFRHGVRECGAFTDIPLEHRRLRRFAGHNQQPWVRHRAAAFRLAQTDANVISIGCSITVRAGSISTMPSRRNAVFSDVNELVSVCDSLAR